MGARFAGTVADLRDCDLVISMVGTDDDLRAIAVGPGGLFDAPRTGVLLVDCSTVSAEVTDELAAAARAVGGDVLAAPVAGGPSVIPEGRLAIVCSGTQSAYQRAETVLESLAHRVIYAGEGAISRHVKILHNLIVAVIAHAVAEVSVLGEAIGAARADLLEFVCAGAAGSPFIRYKSEQMKSLDFTAAFTASLMLKGHRPWARAGGRSRRHAAGRPHPRDVERRCGRRAGRQGHRRAGGLPGRPQRDRTHPPIARSRMLLARSTTGRSIICPRYTPTDPPVAASITPRAQARSSSMA